MRAQIMLRASDIGDHSPHNVGNENDPAVCHIRWLNDSFPGLFLLDQVWGEAIKVSRLWKEWSPTGLVRDPVFCHLLHNGVWDSCETGRPAAEVLSMRYSAAISSQLILRCQEFRLFKPFCLSLFRTQDSFPTNTHSQHDITRISRTTELIVLK